MLELLHKSYIKILFFLVLISVILNFLYHGICESFVRIGIDFDAYYHRKLDICIYPPFWWIFMLPWRIFPYTVAKNLWVTFNLCLLSLFYFGIYYMIIRNQFWNKNLQFWLTVFLSIIVIYFSPLIVTLQTGQANLLLLFLLCLSLWFFLKEKKTISSFLLGLSISMKPLPMILLFYWLLKREYKIFIISLLAILALLLISIFILGLSNCSIYFISSAKFTNFLYTNWQLMNNTSFYAFWCEIGQKTFHNIPLGKLLFYITIGLIMIAWIIVIQRRKENKVPLIIFEYVWTLSFSPLLMYFTEHHHFLLSLPFYLFTVAFWFYIRSTMAKICIIMSWVLVNLGYQITDVSLLPQFSYILRYLSLFGVFIGWISGLFILYSNKFSDY